MYSTIKQGSICIQLFKRYFRIDVLPIKDGTVFAVFLRFRKLLLLLSLAATITILIVSIY